MKNFVRYKIESILNYEYWPYWVFYFPACFYGFYLALRAGSFAYFTAVNPGVKNAGAFGYSKFSLLDQIDDEFKPQSVVLHYAGSIDPFLSSIDENFSWPFIIKPDIGERGKLVEKISNREALEMYFRNAPKGKYILQDYIDYPEELGIFYVKSGNGDSQISSVLMKNFLQITGDGESTLRELLLNNIRAYKRKDYLFDKYKMQLDTILQKGDYIAMEPIGNHNRGTEFVDGNKIIDDKLIAVFTRISDSIKGFDYGRFDLKAKTIEELKNGIGIKIFEVNGVNSEPGHIYDKEINIIEAYRSVFGHMKMMYKIAVQNHSKGIPYQPAGKFYKEMFKHMTG